MSHTPPSHQTRDVLLAKDQAKSLWVKDLILLALFTGFWFCALIGQRSLGNPDEGRYTEIPREMAISGDFVTPRLNGVKYFEKPPLVYWLSAMTFKTFGVSEFTARVWNGLFAVLGVMLTYCTARAIYGRSTGLWSALVLSTSLIYYVLSQIVLLDMAVAVTISGALFSFILAVREPRGDKRLALFLAFYAFMALATLSKGLIGIAIPGAVIFLWVLLLNRWKALWPFHPILGTLLLLAIAAPWHVLAARANPDFLDFYFIHEHWLRFTTRIHGRYEPAWFFIPVLLAGMFPWVFFAWPALKTSLSGGWKSRHRNPEAWFFLIWIVFIFAFFSKSQSKLIPYLLPVFPAVAVLMGRFVSSRWDDSSTSRIKPGSWAILTVFLALAVAAIAAPAPKHQPDLLEILLPLRIMVCTSLMLGVIGIFIGLRRNQVRTILGSLAISSALFLTSVNFGGGALDKASTKEFATMIKPLLKWGDRIYCVGFYAQDLPVYLNRLVSVAEYRGELEFGIEAEPEITDDRFLDREAFLAQWSEPGNAYAIVRNTTYSDWFSKSAGRFKVLAETRRFTLVTKITDHH